MKPKLSRGRVQRVAPVASSCAANTDVPALDNASQVVPSKGTRKYWSRTVYLQPDDYKPWKGWHNEEPPHEGTFMARIKESNRHVTAQFNPPDGLFYRVSAGMHREPIEVWQWKTWKEYADLIRCPWTKK